MMKMKSTGDIGEHCKRFLEHIQELEAAGDKMSDTAQLCQFLFTLTPEYDTVKNIIETSMTDATLRV